MKKPEKEAWNTLLRTLDKILSNEAVLPPGFMKDPRLYAAYLSIRKSKYAIESRKPKSLPRHRHPRLGLHNAIAVCHHFWSVILHRDFKQDFNSDPNDETDPNQKKRLPQNECSRFCCTLIWKACDPDIAGTSIENRMKRQRKIAAAKEVERTYGGFSWIDTLAKKPWLAKMDCELGPATDLGDASLARRPPSAVTIIAPRTLLLRRGPQIRVRQRVIVLSPRGGPRG